MTARVVLMDSGLNLRHPHLAGLASCSLGPTIEESGRISTDAGQEDLLGHGTAAAAAILDLAPKTDLLSIKIFHQRPRCPFAHVLKALGLALDWGPQLINLSLGTSNPRHVADLTDCLERLAQAGCRLIAPASFQGLPSYPGCLPQAVGVLPDANLPRAAPEQRSSPQGTFWYASPYPRDLPNLPRASNLQGSSFAAANLTGFLAREARS